MNIRQIANNNIPTGDFLALLLKNSELLSNFMEFYTGSGDSTRRRKQQGDFAAQARELNAAYTVKTGNPDYFNTGRKIIGDSVRVDIANERMGIDIGSELRSQVRRSAPGVAAKLHNLFINGDGTVATEFQGCKGISDATAGQTIASGTNGLEVILGNDNAAKKAQQNYLELLHELIAQCRGNNKVLVMGAKADARTTSIAREYINWTENTFGNKIKRFDNIPILNIEKNNDDIILANETQGTLANTERIYCVSLEEANGLSFFTTPDGLMVYEPVRNANFIESTIDLIMDTSVFNDKAVASVKGLKF